MNKSLDLKQSTSWHSFCFFLFLCLCCWGNEVIIPSTKVIPPATIFGEDVEYPEDIMDDLSFEFTTGKPFKYDKYPYTAVLTLGEPLFDIDVYYWETSEAARKSFLQGKETIAKEPFCKVGELTKDDEVEYFEFNFSGRSHCSSTVVGNVHFVIKDMYQELGKEKMLEMRKHYISFLKAGLPKKEQKEVSSGVIRKWTNASGTEIEGTLNRFDPKNETVDFTRADGTRFASLPLKTFSTKDQEYIREQGAK